MSILYALLIVIVTFVIAIFFEWAQTQSNSGKPSKNNKIAIEIFGGVCPICLSKGTLHRSAFISSYPIAGAHAKKYIHQLCAEDWVVVSENCQFNVMEDNYVVYMLECHDGKFGWFLYSDPFEPFLDIDLLSWKDLDENSAEQFREAYRDKNLVWNDFLTKESIASTPCSKT